MKNNRIFIQFLKFAIVGISNTLLTGLTIWILLSVFQYSNYLANILGYVIGLINSFVWNQRWTFSNSSKAKNTILKFIVTFAVSYLFQLGNLYLLLHFTHINSYICQLISIIIYTCINFLLNKYYTFKSDYQ